MRESRRNAASMSAREQQQSDGDGRRPEGHADRELARPRCLGRSRQRPPEPGNAVATMAPRGERSVVVAPPDQDAPADRDEQPRRSMPRTSQIQVRTVEGTTVPKKGLISWYSTRGERRAGGCRPPRRSPAAISPKLDAAILGRPRRSHQGDTNTMQPAATPHPATHRGERSEPSRSRSSSPPPTWGTTILENTSWRTRTPPAIASRRTSGSFDVRWWTKPTSAQCPRQPTGRGDLPSGGIDAEQSSCDHHDAIGPAIHAMRRGQVSMGASLGPVAGRSYEVSPTSSCGLRPGTCPPRRHG